MTSLTTLSVINPGTGEEIGSVPLATVEQVDVTVRQAHVGQAAMAAMPAHQRAALLRTVADLMEADAEALAYLDAAENGKPIEQTRGEVAAAIRIFRGYAEEATRLFGRQTPMDAVPGLEHNLAVTMYEPIGVVAALIPFNYPVELYSHKAAAALAAGNAVIVKPPSRCPLSLLRVQGYFDQAGAPQYAHQVIVGGRAVVEAIADHPDIAAVTLTGSTAAGRNVAQRCAGKFKRVYLELGGNDAMIVCEDADVSAAAEAVVLGRLARGNGQICCAVKRVYVADAIYDAFVAELTDRTKRLVVGDQLSDATEVGPLIAEGDARDVEAAIGHLISEGARLTTGGTRRGAFIEPTVLADVPMDSPTLAEEIFGPVAPIVRFTDPMQAVQLANDSPYGLQAAVWTRDINRAFTLAKALDAGGVMINGSTALRAENLPFGGTKDTGGYREGIHDTVLDFTKRKTMVVIGAFA